MKYNLSPVKPEKGCSAIMVLNGKIMRKVFWQILFFVHLSITAQNVMVVYERTVLFGRKHFILFINDTLSYWTHIKDLSALDTTLEIKGHSINASHYYRIESPEYKAYPYKNFVLKDKRNHQTYFVNHAFKNVGNDYYLYAKDSLFPMKWEPLPEHRFVLGYICNAAKTTFRGRTYVAYYAPELPYNDGPWKFGRLPGLILEVKDQSGEFHWEAKKIILHYQGVPDMPNLKEYHFYDWPEYVKIVRKKEDESIAKIKARRVREGDNSWGRVRVIKEEVIHQVYSPSGVEYGEHLKLEGDEKSEKAKKKRKKTWFRRKHHRKKHQESN